MSPPALRPGLHPEDRPPAPDAPFATLDAPDLAPLAGRPAFRWSHGGHLDPASPVQRRKLEGELAATLPAGTYSWSLDEAGDVGLVVAAPALGPLLEPPGPPDGQLALLLVPAEPSPPLEEAARRLAPLRRGYGGAALAAVLTAWPGALALRFAHGQAQAFGTPAELAALQAG